MNKQLPSLLTCLLLDLAGYATYSIPVIGEWGDLVWAPLSGLLFYQLFGSWKGAVGGLFSFAEELLPFTDFIPSFTIMWVWQYLQQKKAGAAVPVGTTHRLNT